MIKELEILLKTRELRELSAATKVQECRNKLSVSRDQRRRRERNIKDYQIWLKKQEEKLFITLKNIPVGVNSLEEFRVTTAKLKEKETSLINRTKKAKKSVKNARKALAEAKKEYLEAIKAKEKLKEFVDAQRKKSVFDAEYKEELESEFNTLLKASSRHSPLH